MPTLDVSRVRAIRTRAEYDAALAEAVRLVELDPSPRSDAGARLVGLAVLIEAYEKEQFPVGDTTPQEVVDFMLEQRGMTRSDLHEVMGGRSRVSEFFAGKRELSIAQLVRLSATLRIPSDLLLPKELAGKGRAHRRRVAP
jgi:HTH-type transcriptional regulator/antitoxin HigA